MAKFCTSCGSQVEDTANNCPSCGAALNNNAAPAASEAQAALDASLNGGASTSSGNANTSKYIGMGIAAVVAILVIVLICNIFSAIFAGTYKTPLKNLFNGIEKENEKKFTNAFSERMLDESKIKDDDMEEYLESIYKTLEEIYGEDIKIDFKVVEKEKVDKDDIDDLNDLLEEVDKKLKVKKAYTLEIEIEIEGDDDDATLEWEVGVAKFKGDGWCLVEMPSEFNSYYKWADSEISADAIAGILGF